MLVDRWPRQSRQLDQRLGSLIAPCTTLHLSTRHIIRSVCSTDRKLDFQIEILFARFAPHHTRQADSLNFEKVMIDDAHQSSSCRQDATTLQVGNMYIKGNLGSALLPILWLPRCRSCEVSDLARMVSRLALYVVPKLMQL